MKFFRAFLLLLIVVVATTRAEEEETEEAVEIEAPVEEEVLLFTPPEPSGFTFLHEAFLTEDILDSRWVRSEAKKDGVEDEISKYDGQWAIEATEEGSLKGDLGLVLKSKAKHHAIAVALDKTFEFDEEPFIAQYEVKFQNTMDCGGSYVKFLAGEPDLDSFHDKTRYSIMFGPDKCGADSKLHFIFQHKNPVTGEYEEKHAKKSMGFATVFSDQKSHLYTLVIQPDNSYEILVDQKSVSSGNLLNDFTPAVNPPAEIEDPDDHKPEEWDDNKKISDPEAVKPEDWDEDAPARISDPAAAKPEGWLDDESELIDDPDAEKPDDWDEELDGEWEPPQIANPNCEDIGCGDWEAPMINNPDFQGKWRPELIDNPNYSGEWSPSMITNPNFFEDLEPFKMSSIGAIGLELWSMTDNIYFDNFIITSDREVANKWALDTWKLKRKTEGGGSSGDSVVTSFRNALEEKPWLWVVVGLVIIIPLFLCIKLCFGKSGSSEEVEDTKKTDAPTPSDAIEEEDEGAEGEEEEEKSDNSERGDGSAVRHRKAKSSKKSDLEETTTSPEEDNAEEAVKEEDKDEEDKEEEDKEQKKGESPSVRKSPRQKSRKD